MHGNINIKVKIKEHMDFMRGWSVFIVVYATMLNSASKGRMTGCEKEFVEGKNTRELVKLFNPCKTILPSV